MRNNHAITETLALYLVGLLFPQFPESGEWKKKGKKWFEEEIKYQVAEDGTYLQFSMNYHRVVVQLLTWAITLADRNGERFCDEVYKRAYQSVNFLYQCQDDSTGWLSNYGSNDGALFFKLNDCDYRDYRPQLDALYYLLTSEHLYDRQYEDREWYLCEWKANRQMYPPIKNSLVAFLLIREDIIVFVKRILFLLSDVEDIRTDLRMRIICIWIFGIKERIVCLMGVVINTIQQRSYFDILWVRNLIIQ